MQVTGTVHAQSARPRYRHTFRKPSGSPIEFVSREVTEGDHNFIYSSYLKSFRRGHPMVWVPHALYFKPQASILARLLRQADVRVACFPEDPTEILGYIVYQHVPDALVLHYVYTKLHGRGVGLKLLRSVAGDEKLIIATHMCDDYGVLREKVSPMTVRYDPYLLSRLAADG
jgi:hypothetical protein